MIEVHRSTERKVVLDLSLALTSAGIPHEWVHEGGGQRLLVHDGHAESARAEVEAYLAEAAEDAPPKYVAPPKRARAWPGAAVYITVLFVLFVLQKSEAFGLAWLDAGRSHGASIRAGEFWRALTALTLHADIAHILGNVVLGAFLGGLFAETVGTGVAWSTITLSGFLGNVANAYLRGAERSSIGASTAVFGALGALAAWQWAFARPARHRGLRRSAPIIGALILLGYLGMSTDEGVDVLAHATGFTAGLLAALAPAWWTVRRHVPIGVERLLRVLPLAAIVVAWAVALR